MISARPLLLCLLATAAVEANVKYDVVEGSQLGSIKPELVVKPHLLHNDRNVFVWGAPTKLFVKGSLSAPIPKGSVIQMWFSSLVGIDGATAAGEAARLAE